jgi:hypothetical protein
VIPVLPEQAFEANGAEAIFAKGFYVLVTMDLTFAQVLVSVGNDFGLVLLLHHLLLLGYAKLHIMRIVCILTCSHVFGVPFNA